MIAYPIQAALSSGIFEQVLVSTDDPQIAELAKSLGAEVPFFRSEKASSDTATTIEVLVEVLDQLKESGLDYSVACCIYAVNPFLTSGKLSDSYSQFSGGSLDTLVSACQYSQPVQRSFVSRNGKMELLLPEFKHYRSQDLEPVYFDAAQFYWFNTDVVREKGSLYTDNTGVFELPISEVEDIDTPDDWERALIKFQQWKNH